MGLNLVVRCLLGRDWRSFRAVVYLAATLIAAVTAGVLGKDMRFDTLNYHLYAGFSALHDRFGQDYFPAGPQSYLNPYVYVPFYLLAASRLPALAVAIILAVAQSAILWLTYEMAVEASPAQTPPTRLAMAVCALALAFANPILINQFGSSYADITTAEIVLGGWLLLIGAIHRPSLWRIACGGLLLGAATVLKATNAVHAVSALVIVAFVPDDRRGKILNALLFGAAAAAAFVVVCAPWSIMLERHFGSPLFPLLNGWFQSPQYPTGSMLDYRFIPDSVASALLRPFAILSPALMVDDEFRAADLRYAALLVLAVILLASWTFGRLMGVRTAAGPRARALAALGCAFAVDWTLWLIASGNGRYFIAMACVASVLIIAFVYKLFAFSSIARNGVLAALFCLQAILLCMGASFGDRASWSSGRWFDVSVPAALARTPDLYIAAEDPSDSFVVPFLPKGSGFIDIRGDYALGPDGANGVQVEALIHRYQPHLRMLMRDPRPSARTGVPFPQFTYANDALESFGLRADAADCARIAVRNVAPGVAVGYLLSCRLVPDPVDQAAESAGRHSIDVVFDRLEDACPDLFHPRRPATQDYSTKRNGRVWARRYPDTGLMALVGHGVVQVVDGNRAGPATYVGRESAWASAPQGLQCRRRDERYQLRILPRVD